MTNPAYNYKRKGPNSVIPGKFKKKIMVGDYEEIYLDFEEIANNSFKRKL